MLKFNFNQYIKNKKRRIPVTEAFDFNFGEDDAELFNSAKSDIDKIASTVTGTGIEDLKRKFPDAEELPIAGIGPLEKEAYRVASDETLDAIIRLHPRDGRSYDKLFGIIKYYDAGDNLNKIVDVYIIPHRQDTFSQCIHDILDVFKNRKFLKFHELHIVKSLYRHDYEGFELGFDTLDEAMELLQLFDTVKITDKDEKRHYPLLIAIPEDTCPDAVKIKEKVNEYNNSVDRSQQILGVFVIVDADKKNIVGAQYERLYKNIDYVKIFQEYNMRFPNKQLIDNVCANASYKTSYSLNRAILDANTIRNMLTLLSIYELSQTADEETIAAYMNYDKLEAFSQEYYISRRGNIRICIQKEVPLDLFYAVMCYVQQHMKANSY